MKIDSSHEMYLTRSDSSVDSSAASTGTGALKCHSSAIAIVWTFLITRF